MPRKTRKTPTAEHPTRPDPYDVAEDLYATLMAARDDTPLAFTLVIDKLIADGIVRLPLAFL